jgi:hypothetical protein
MSAQNSATGSARKAGQSLGRLVRRPMAGPPPGVERASDDRLARQNGRIPLPATRRLPPAAGAPWQRAKALTRFLGPTAGAYARAFENEMRASGLAQHMADSYPGLATANDQRPNGFVRQSSSPHPGTSSAWYRGRVSWEMGGSQCSAGSGQGARPGRHRRARSIFT